jgi:hypothetical protein
MYHYLKGEKVGNATFIEEVDARITLAGLKERRALFQCSCGKSFTAAIRHVRAGNTKSCGCMIGKWSKHRLRFHPLYGVWATIKSRCLRPSCRDFRFYGARGITLAPYFVDDFKAFYDYVTSLPGYSERDTRKLSIDRIDTLKGYEIGNLRWATAKEQANNMRNNLKRRLPG